jgi:hypothetical protein
MRAIGDRTHWSAAFISFVVRQALNTSGSPAAFAFSASHSVYVEAALRNDFNDLQPPAFYGIPPTGVGAEPPQPGDIFGGSRTRAIDDYADALRAARDGETYFSHFDIVTEVTDEQVVGIGGNVSNSVSKSRVQLANGLLPIRAFRFDRAGQVIAGPFICLIQHKI